jgi:hypothetical protein
MINNSILKKNRAALMAAFFMLEQISRCVILYVKRPERPARITTAAGEF